MKFLVVCFSFIATAAFAQTMGIKDIPADGDTTIKIEKGRTADSEYQITTGSEDIEGDAAPLLKDARENWKKACADWKKETKEMNTKDSQVLTMNCGKMQCSKNEMESVCQSTGTHKIRVKTK